MHSSAVRTIDAYQALMRRAEALLEDLDEVTPVHGIPTTDLSDEDSAVIVVIDAIKTLKS